MIADAPIPSHFRIAAQPVADPRAVVHAPGARFTVLTSRMIRMESSPSESFEDCPSQVFWYRDAPPPPFETARAGDEIIEGPEHTKIFVDRKSLIYLNNTVLDYDTSLMSKGFVFQNPNAKGTCGCGTSFTV